MIKCEVVFEDFSIEVNGYCILIQHDYDYVKYEIFKIGDYENIIESIPSSVEKAIKYCLEN